MADDPEAKASGAPRRLRPTVIEPPARRAADPRDVAASPAAPRTPAATVVTPTVIPGAQRKRIAVGAADMQRLSPGVAPAIAAGAVRLVDGFVAESARERHVDLWGQAAQERCAVLVPDFVALSQVEVLGRAQGYVARIVQVLGMIDIETPGDGLLALLLGDTAGAAEKRIDTPRKLRAARAELKQLAGLSRAALEPLLKLVAALEDQARGIDEAGLEIEAAALSAMFLAEHLSSARPELSRLFLQREMSLTRTVVELRGDRFERGRLVAEARALATAIEQEVIVTLLDWLESTVVLDKRRVSPLETTELQGRLRTLLRKLES